MKTKFHFTILVAVLILLGLGLTAYKVLVLGFSLSPSEKVKVWTVESVISFTGDGGPVEVSLNLPDNRKGLVVMERRVKKGSYEYSMERKGKAMRGVWRKNNAEGPQKLYLQSQIYRKDWKESRPVEDGYKIAELPFFSSAAEDLARGLIMKAKEEGNGPVEIAKSILRQLNRPEENGAAAILLEKKKDFGGTLELARALINKAGVTARTLKGFFLDKDSSNIELQGYVEIRDGEEWLLIDPVEVEVLNSGSFLLWQMDKESVLEVTGGYNSKVRFSSLATSIIANKAAIDAGLGKSKSMFVDFSIYSLPIKVQNSFRLLLLIPFGALVVVIMRNLIGIRTSGTFLPILIAMTFIQTSLLWGLALFILIVSMGLVLRSYLSRLNLLLVPRISAVLVFVIVIYVFIAVTSYKLGSELGLMVSFFPMIIISWTIERMSILWEEEGPKEVFIQGGGSLLTASLVYLLMTNRYIEHLSYSFPELLLVVLAVILCIGSYTGYRLSELGRFEPMGRL